jgi:hypothetical protein
MRSNCGAIKMHSYYLSAIAAVSFVMFDVAPCRADDIPSDYKVGDKVANSVRIGKRWFPLEDGEYTVIGVSNRKSSSTVGLPGDGANLISIILGKSMEKKPHSIVIVEGNTEIVAHSKRNGWQYSKNCERKDVHFIQKNLNVDGGEQNCYIINHYTTVLSSKHNLADSPYRQALAFANSKNVDIPVNFVGVNYRFADFSDFVNIEYRFNPEYEGFPRSSDSSWAGSNWHRDRIGADPRRVEYVNKIIEWAKNWHPKVEAGFNKKWKPEISSVPARETQALETTPKTDHDIEWQLIKLKKLLDDSLIDEIDYNTQKKRILDSL